MKSPQLCLLFVCSVLLSACGPIRSTAGLVRADQALDAARNIDAEKHAPYAMTLAQALRDKAWEEQGYGEYDTSTNMAEEAEKLALEAIAVTRKAVASVPKPVDDEDLFGEEDPTESPSPKEPSPSADKPSVEESPEADQ